MVRMQIQITEEQAKALRRLAARLNVSQAELARRGIDQLLQSKRAVLTPEQRKRALDVVGMFESDRDDVGERHDDYLAEIYAEYKP